MPYQITEKPKIARPKGSYVEQLGVCLLHECNRFNELLKVIKISLKDLKKAIRGEEIMNEDCEKICNSLYLN